MVWWMAVALAGRADGIEDLVEAGKVDAAQKKCTRWSAFLPETEAPLREACAKAMLPAAQATDTFAGWARYQADWKGTSMESVGRAGEAATRLRDLGDEATETEYRAFLTTYEATPSAKRATVLLGEAALRSIRTAEDAKRVARTYPAVDGLEAALVPWFDAFVTVDVEDGRPVAKLDPPLSLPGRTLVAEWAGQQADTPVPWDVVALRHLEAHGLSSAVARVLLGEPEASFPPCSLPDAKVGVRVRYGSLSAFVPRDVSCGGGTPAFVSVRGERIAGLSLRAGRAMAFAGPGDAQVEWVGDRDVVGVPVLGDVGPDVIPLGSVVGQQVGPGHLVHPLAGGLPWYVLEGPPPTAQPLPKGVAVSPDVGRVQVLASLGRRVQVAGVPDDLRELPNGDVRMLSPLYQELTGLHAGNPAFARRSAAVFRPGFWPEGSAPPVLEGTERDAVKTELARFGVQLRRAWAVQLHADEGVEIPFEGTWSGKAVRGVLDPRESGDGHRLFVIEAPDRRDSPTVFRHDARTHFGWIGTRGARPAMEVFRFEPAGLTHHLLTP